ncbi:ABC transporter ATP-binding protein [Bacilli bacterium]|nr:glycine/betaine ABC transporter ATP-binding protein [Bacilli bacterium VT-13-104]PZD83406.1 ABC transporter ATP-binding protein [Bacilli bacterium]PZD84585.1 ABC transporter ATP-binding protein [Bacilli bacterium]PZD86871.1 ABC transporter ATP-binding protein [Bacilli bacterium]RCO05862.1 ABC transporter ATP-binding protein [Bacilli bacterium]
MITFENVSKVYEDGTKAVDSVNFTINKGEFFVLIGPSGCGKTTTLKMMNRLIPLSDGTIFVNGRKISDFNIHELRWDIGYVLQQIALFPHMTIEENIAIVPELKKWKKEDIHRRVTELLEMVGLDPDTYRNRKPSELSGGEQQRVGVIRALAADPEIILMDEPFSALDPLSREKLQDDIVHLQKSIKKTIIFVTHDMKEAMKLADRICLMNDGKIVQLGAPEELINHPSNDFVRDFVSGASLMNSDFNLEDMMEPIHHNNLLSSPSLTVRASLEEVLTLLSEHERIKVEKGGKVIGYINRQMLIHYLSESVPVGGNDHV